MSVFPHYSIETKDKWTLLCGSATHKKKYHHIVKSPYYYSEIWSVLPNFCDEHKKVSFLARPDMPQPSAAAKHTGKFTVVHLDTEVS